MIIINNYHSFFFRQYNKLVIFDKDGTLVKDHGYVHKIEDFAWKSPGLELLKVASAQRACICVLSNQSGIEKKLYTKKQSIAFCKHLIRSARELNIEIKKIIICPHIENSAFYCNCRKPKIGMYLKLRKFNWAKKLDAIMIGNSSFDFEFSKNCGIPYLDVANIDSINQLSLFLNHK